jgi:hypothetical protein
VAALADVADMHGQLMALIAPAGAGLEVSMTHSRMSLGLLIGVAVLGVVLSGLVWLARQQSRQARILILTKGEAPVQDRSPRRV